MFKGLKGFFARMFGSNPKRRGRQVMFAALLAFNSESDTEKFQKISEKLRDFLSSNRTLTEEMVKRFSVDAARALDVNPVLFRIVVSEITANMDDENGDKNARLFIEGVVQALRIGNY